MGCVSMVHAFDWRSHRRNLRRACILLTLLFCEPQSFAQNASELVFRNPTFEQLAETKVTSVARKEQNYFTTSAAVYVIRGDEIRRSGARSLPEALRLAPGVEVARINPGRYAVGIRGFNNEFTTKLLVLQDGRYLYTPLFAGTFWDMQDTLLDDVERIEIVRGPGGTAWGANAVNGVINIVTKSATETRGLTVIGGAGDEERRFGSVRYGGDLKGIGAFRVYAAGFDRDSGVDSQGLPTNDGGQQARAGFRIDGFANDRDSFALLGEGYDGRAKQNFLNQSNDVDVEGAYVLGRWERSTERSTLSLQTQFDSSRRETFQGIADRDEWGVEFVDRLQALGNHDLTFGLNYRRSRNEARTVPALTFSPSARTLTYAGAFIDDAVRMFSDRLTVSAGMKFEHNDFTGIERLPNVRLLWQPNANQVGWLAFTRGARIPSIADHDSTATIPGVLSLPNPNLPAEETRALEAGWRVREGESWSLDLAVFTTDYDNLRTRETSFIAVPPTVVRTRDAKLNGQSDGIEAVYVMQAGERWRIQAQGSYLHVALDLENDSTDRSAPDEVGVSPNWQAALRNTIDLASTIQLQVSYRYVDALAALQVPVYHGLDVRAAWRAKENLEIAFCGQSLLQSRHLEFKASSGQPPGSEVERSVYLQVRWGL